MTDTASTEAPGAVTGGLRTMLRLEGVALFAGMTLLYGIWDGSWWVYAILFFVPDLSFAAYLAGSRTGALVYNAAHSYLAPMAMMTAGFATSSSFSARCFSCFVFDSKRSLPELMPTLFSFAACWRSCWAMSPPTMW